jgi:hypothetical protein
MVSSVEPVVVASVWKSPTAKASAIAAQASRMIPRPSRAAGASLAWPPAEPAIRPAP